MLLLITTYLFLSFYNEYDSYHWKKKIIFAILIGTLFAMSTFFKNFGSVFLNTIFCLYMIELIKNGWNKMF